MRTRSLNPCTASPPLRGDCTSNSRTAFLRTSAGVATRSSRIGFTGVSLGTSTPIFTSAGVSIGTTAEVRKNAVLEFDVQSPRRGGLAVHGLSDLVRIERGQRVKVRLRAIYSGRFPLHFHGIDGSHFEIAVVEVRD